MFALFLVLFSFTTLGQCRFDPLSQEFIDHINSLNTTWKAKQNFPGRTISELQRLCGTKLIKDDPLMPPLRKDRPLAYPYPMPAEFDARTVWPHCSTISKIGNQGHCGSCWAFSTSSAMNDRYCIHFNKYVEISAQDMVSCCAPAYGQNGCDSAPLTVAYDCWLRLGIVTGGQYGSNYGCQPYSIPTCSPHSVGTIDKVSIPDCTKDPNITPPCSTYCRSGYSIPYFYDKYFGSSYYPLASNVQSIQQEIMFNGPVTLGFDVYDDLMNYGSGVYKPTAGSRYVGGHAVKAIGWGTENGVDYWLLANSWGPEWGNKGFFKFHRGLNECNIESNGMAGIPLNKA